MILEQYRGCFERVYILSPSIDMHPQWEPVKEYMRPRVGPRGARRSSSRGRIVCLAGLCWIEVPPEEERRGAPV